MNELKVTKDLGVEYDYELLIDTNKYTGNFERPLCAFATGLVGDCGVGKRSIQSDRDEFGYDGICEIVRSIPGDDGCCRPCESTPGEKGDHHSMVIHISSENYTEEWAAEILGKLIANVHLYGKGRDIDILNVNLVRTTKHSEMVTGEWGVV